MRHYLIILMVLALIFPISGFAWQDDTEPEAEAGIVEPSEGYQERFAAEDEQLVSVAQEYADEIQAIMKEIENEDDPLERERLQKEIHEIKSEREIALMELNIQIAREQGDDQRAVEIEQALEALYHPPKPVAEEPQQSPDVKPGAEIQPRIKQPDDQ